MTDIYKRLAERLNNFPNTFPATEAGMRLLEIIFSPEAAEMALNLKPLPETLEVIAERLGKPVLETKEILDEMVNRGQIGSVKISGERTYFLLPFVMGILEVGTWYNRMTKEVAKLVDVYLPDIMKTYGATTPAEARVIPVKKAIDVQLHVHSYEDLHQIIERCKSFLVHKCWCRLQAAAAGHPCPRSYELERCLAFSTEEGEFEEFSLGGRIIAKEEALEILGKAEKEGLVHMSYNIKDGHNFVCSCCPCCCGLLRGLLEYGAIHAVAKSNYWADINQETCSACGICAEERCPTGAIAEESGKYHVLTERCIGCGVCMSACPTDAIELVRKPESEQDEPPEDLIQLAVKKAANRGVEFKLD